MGGDHPRETVKYGIRNTRVQKFLGALHVNMNETRRAYTRLARAWIECGKSREKSLYRIKTA